MAPVWNRILTDDHWSREVPLSPQVLAERLTNQIATGDPDTVSSSEASKGSPALVGKLNEKGFRVRERFGWFNGGRHHPVAWALFTPTDKGTRVECHFPGTGIWRAVFVCGLGLLLTVFIVMLLLVLFSHTEQGAFALFMSGSFTLIGSLVYWKFRSAVGELKDEIEQAVGRSSLDPMARSRRKLGRR
ncbi:MAG TPA: hypothetical protein PK760_10065 [Flavobacteriales bacterium]|nr:hypothetical protein [Flavobacteriales bacterium]